MCVLNQHHCFHKYIQLTLSRTRVKTNMILRNDNWQVKNTVVTKRNVNYFLISNSLYHQYQVLLLIQHLLLLCHLQVILRREQQSLPINSNLFLQSYQLQLHLLHLHISYKHRKLPDNRCSSKDYFKSQSCINHKSVTQLQ